MIFELRARKSDKYCRHRSCIIRFPLYLQLSKNYRQVTSNVFSRPVSTFVVWFTKITNISVWLPLGRYVLFESDICSIPKNPLSNSRYLSIKGKYLVQVR